ncbi:hypothetical protein [Thalassotalea ganghwensis]
MNSTLVNKSYLFALVFLLGCDNSENDEINCTTEAVPAITISVTDKESGQSINCGVTALIEDTNFSEELINPDSDNCDNTLMLNGAFERGGIYNVHVYKDGYLDWSQYNIEVTKNTCHVATVVVEAVLEK